MRLSARQWRRLLATCQFVALLGVVLGSDSPAYSLQASRPDAPKLPDDQRNIQKVAIDTLDRVTLRNGLNAGEQGQRITETDATCLLPPLTLMSNPTVAVEQLRRTAKARNKYQQACAALRKNNSADAEKYLQKALRDYPKYAAAWVTLGQIFAMQQRVDEGPQCLFSSFSRGPELRASIPLSGRHSRSRAVLG